jgi:hypothetical protein
MIVVRLQGGLGNQLFEYAAARRLAESHRTSLAVDVSAYAGGRDKRHAGLEGFARCLMLFEFCTAARPASAEDLHRLRDPFMISRKCSHRAVRALRRFWPGLLLPRTHFRERGYTFDPSVLELPDNTYLDGYWQSEKYFRDIAGLIRSELQPRDPALLEYAEDYLAKLRNGGRAVVAVHVRRGDFAFAKEVLRSTRVALRPLSLECVHECMRRFGNDAVFLVFSDTEADRNWCRQNVRGTNLFFSERHSDMQDFVLMSRCDHHIIANSSFSWWAAWLNPSRGKRIVAPRAWPRHGSSGFMDTRDLIPLTWETV